jgi:hypothetical protein
MGPAGGPSPTREWGEEGGAPRGSRAEGQSQRELGLAPLRDSPGASWEGGWDSPGASSGTVVGSDIGRAQGQSRREQGGREGGRDSPGASREGGREGGTVPARAQGQLRALISEELRDS